MSVFIINFLHFFTINNNYYCTSPRRDVKVSVYYSIPMIGNLALPIGISVGTAGLNNVVLCNSFIQLRHVASIAV